MSGARRRAAVIALGEMNQPLEMMATRKRANRRRFRREMRPMHQHTEEGECTRNADGNQSLFLPLLRILIIFFAFACRFKSRIVDRFDQCFRRDLFVMGDDCVARHNVHSHFAYTCDGLSARWITDTSSAQSTPASCGCKPHPTTPTAKALALKRPTRHAAREAVRDFDLHGRATGSGKVRRH